MKHAASPELAASGSPASIKKQRRLFFIGSSLVFAVVLIVTVMSWVAIKRIDESERLKIESTLNTVLHTVRETITVWADDRMDDLDKWGKTEALRRLVQAQLAVPRNRESLLASEALAEIRRLFEEEIFHRGDLGLFVIAPDYTNIASSRDANVGVVSLFKERERVLEDVFAGRSRLVLPIRSDVPLPGVTGEMKEDEPTMFIAAPVWGDDGEVIAAMTVRIDPSLDFTRFAQTGRIGKTGETYAFNKSGMLITESRFDDELREAGLIGPDQRGILNIELRDPGAGLSKKPVPPESRPFTKPVKEALAGRAGIDLEGYMDYRGSLVVGAWAWVEEYGFGLVTEMDESEACETFYRTRKAIIVVNSLTAVLFLSLIGTLFLIQKQSREAARIVADWAKLPSENPHPVLRINSGGEIMMANAAAAPLLDFWESGPGRRAPGEIMVLVKSALESGKARNLEIQMDNAALYFTLAPITGQGYVNVYGVDITSRIEAEAALRKSEARLAGAQRIAKLGNWSWDIATGRLEWSEEIYRIFGVDSAETQPTYEMFQESVHPGDRQAVANAVEEALEGGKPYSIEHRIILPDGSERHVHERGEVQRDEFGNPSGMVGTVQDVTEIKSYERHIELSTSVFENIAEGVIVTDTEGTIQFVNRAFTQITGYTEEEALGQTPRILRSERQGKSFYETMWADLTSKGKWEGELWNRRKNGEAYLQWMNISALEDQDGVVRRYVSVFHDITEMRLAEQELERQVYQDALTGLPNRLLLRDRLSQAMAGAALQRGKTGILSIDLDNFKNINDRLGHVTGDLLLQQVAGRLKECVDEGDTVARMGGDEYMIVLSGLAGEDAAAAVARKVLYSLSRPFMLDGAESYITASIGMAFFPNDGHNIETLIKHADIAMYRAKEAGKNGYELFREDMHERVMARLQLENDMRWALEREEFVVYYQPKINAKGEVMAGAEALIRWVKEDGTLVSPMDFIPIAEETGMILQLGEWTIREVARQIKEWEKSGYGCIHVAVNLSPKQFEQSKLPDIINSAIKEAGIEKGCMNFEITESHLMGNIDRAISMLERLRATGGHVYLDDFGTGYSSFNYLSRLPVDALKIDKSFVDGVPGDAHKEQIVTTIISLSKSLGIRVIAEGVETKDQVVFLRAGGCDEMQGYYYSKPLPAGEFLKFVKGKSGKK